MEVSDDQVKKAAELKLWLENRIAELQDEIARLKETLAIVNSSLTASTFRPAIEMMAEQKEIPETRELKRDKGGQVVALASVTTDSVAVSPAEGVKLKMTTPPLKSFLLGKILQGMKEKDQELADEGRLQGSEVLRFDAEEKNGLLERLVIENYRDKARLSEILNTTAWTFSRMLEK